MPGHDPGAQLLAPDIDVDLIVSSNGTVDVGKTDGALAGRVQDLSVFVEAVNKSVDNNDLIDNDHVIDDVIYVTVYSNETTCCSSA